MQKFKTQPHQPYKTVNVSVREAAESGGFDGDVIQLGPGFDEGTIKRRMFGDTSLGLVRFEPKASVRTAQPTGYVTFTIPVSEHEAWLVNGIEGKAGCFFLNTGADETEILAIRRNSLIGSVPTRQFLPEYNALTGSETGSLTMPSGRMSLPQPAYSKMIKRLLSAENERQIAETLASAVAIARRPDQADTLKAARKHRAVSDAREWMQSSQLSEVRLSDLCRVTGVSAPTLTAAFRYVTGLTPMSFVAHLRLSRARDVILRQSNRRGAIKNAALSEGFLQLGRFSAFYQSVYGELPSETLPRRC